ncbi:MAG: acyl-CoA dehydrogenase family protein [Acetobacteraceae bacterium]|jgi:alkylation response protein AidB-like acyl-CoA dehydrogenase
MIHLSDKGRDYIQRVRDLGLMIDAAADTIDATRDLPPQLFAALRACGLFRLVQPTEYGGAELDPPSLVQVIEAVAQHDASTAWCLGQTNICAMTSAYLEPAVAQDIFGPDTGILAWGPGPGEARVVAGGFEVSGKFDFASGSRLASFLGAHVPVIEPDGTRRLGANGKPMTYTMFFPKRAALVRDTWQVMGLRGTGSDSYTLTNLFVPEAYSLPRYTARQPRVSGKLYVFTPSTLYASSFAGIALGIARAVMDAFVKDVKDTTPRGASRTRGENHVIQSQVAQNEARLRSARMFLLGSVSDIWDEAQNTGELTEEQLVTIRMASTWAIQCAREVVAQLYGAAGALAIFNSRPFERRFRDIHTVTQQIQGHPAHFETVGQILLGREPDRPMFTF